MDDFCRIGGKIVSIPTNNRCNYCIRPAKKLRLTFRDLCWVAQCRTQGCDCSQMCSNWTFSNGFCVFHNVLRREYGFPENIVEDWIIEGLPTKIRRNLYGYTFKDLVALHKKREGKENVCTKSIVNNMVKTYDFALSSAARLHFLIKEVFNQHLLPELYPSYIWK